MGHAALTVMVEQEYTETEDATLACVAELMAPYDDRWRRLRSPRCSTGWAAGLAWNTPMPIASATPSPPGRLRITRGSSMCSTSWATRRRRWSVAIPPPTMPRKRPTRTQRSAQRRGFWRGRTGPVNPLLPKPIMQAQLDAVAAELNGRHRQTLGWASPSEKFAEAVALTG